MRTLVSALVAGLLTSLLTACATPVMPTPSGFLGEPEVYAGMRPSEYVDGVWVDGRSGRALRQLQLVLLPPIEVVPTPGGNIDATTFPLAQEVASTLRDEIVSALIDRYPVVSNPGPHAMLLRVAITDIEITDGRLGRGATMEAEIRDSRTGRRLAAVVATAEAHGPGASALDVARAWAGALRARIDQSHLGDDPTAW